LRRGLSTLNQGLVFRYHALLPAAVNPRQGCRMSMGCRARLAQGPQGSLSQSWPRSLNREVSLRSAPMWFDLLLFSYNFQLIINELPLLPKIQPPKVLPLPETSLPDTSPVLGLPAPQTAGPRRHERPCEITHTRAVPGERLAIPDHEDSSTSLYKL
jgi:hypothetical protein